MKVSLANTSGLSDADPLFRILRIADQFLDWCESWHDLHRTVSADRLLAALTEKLGPLQLREIKPEAVGEFRDWLLKHGEPELAKVTDLAHGAPMCPKELRLLLFFVFANLNLLKAKEGRRVRSIDDQWQSEA